MGVGIEGRAQNIAPLQVSGIVAIEVIGYIVVAELPLRGIEGRAQNIAPLQVAGYRCYRGRVSFRRG